MTPAQTKLIIRSFQTETSRKAQAVHGPTCKICRKATKGARRAHRRGVRLLAQAMGVGLPVPAVRDVVPGPFGWSVWRMPRRPNGVLVGWAA